MNKRALLYFFMIPVLNTRTMEQPTKKSEFCTVKNVINLREETIGSRIASDSAAQLIKDETKNTNIATYKYLCYLCTKAHKDVEEYQRCLATRIEHIRNFFYGTSWISKKHRSKSRRGRSYLCRLCSKEYSDCSQSNFCYLRHKNKSLLKCQRCSADKFSSVRTLRAHFRRCCPDKLDQLNNGLNKTLRG